MRDAQRGAMGGDERGLTGAFWPETMVHCRCLDATGKGGMREEEEREAVRTARNGES